MKNRIFTAIEIYTLNGVKRFSTDRIVSFEGGEKKIYLPYLKSPIELTSEVNLEGSSPVPSDGVEIADKDRDLLGSMEELEYESFESVCKFFDAQFNVLFEISGYLTDVSYADGTFSGTFRTDEDKNSYDFLKLFSYDTFQNIEVLRAENVSIEPVFSLKSDAVWSVLKTSFQSKRVLKQSHGFDPPRHVSPGMYYIRTNTLSNSYTDYVSVEAFAIVVNDDVSSGLYEFVYTDGAPVTVSYTATVPTDTEADIIEGLRASAVSGGLTANVVDGIKLYIEGDPANLSSFTKTAVYYDSNTAGSTQILKPVERQIFENPNGTGYKVAILGDPDSPDCERIAYGYALKGQIRTTAGFFRNMPDDHWYLSLIPTDSIGDPVNLDSGGTYNYTDIDPSVNSFGHPAGTANEFRDSYKIKNSHAPFSGLSPYGVRDVLYVSANGLEISSIDDPNLGVGFISLGDTFAGPESQEYLRFYRYKVVEILNSIYDDNLSDGRVIDEVYKLELHNKRDSVDDTHFYTFDVSTQVDPPKRVDLDTKVNLAGYEFTAGSLDLHMTHIPDEVYSRILNPTTRGQMLALFRDRYKGHRIDMFDDFSEFTEDIQRQFEFNSTSFESQGVSRENQRLINNASGKFAVCTKSELLITSSSGYIRERVHFYLSNASDVRRLWVEANQDGVDADESDPDRFGYFDLGGRPDFYVNYMTYKPEQDRASDYAIFADSYSRVEQEAVDYFLSKRYRVIHDPVPEKSSDLGKYFPVVYGYVKEVPLVQCISKKALGAADQTAGDDYYVYASHPCDIKSDSDIVISLFSEEEQENNERNDFASNFKDVIIKNPFPSYVDDHYQFVLGEGDEVAKLAYYGRLFSPYATLEDKKALEGYLTYGIQLRGSEWDFRAGKLDRRYPIRNGVGSSKLFGTFGGWVDKSGVITGQVDRLIEHPCDIINHFISYYGRYPFNRGMIDDANLRAVKSQTPRYRASCFIDSQITVSELIQKMSKQFALFTYLSDGAIKFTNVNFEKVDSSSPIIEGLNLLDGVEQETEGYKNIYSEVVYSYKKNYRNGNFEGLVFLNKNNNENCAIASRAKGGKGSLKIEADFCQDDYTARRVANTYARILSSRRIKYSLSILRVEGIDIEPGKFVPLTYLKYGLDSEPVFINSVTQNERTLDVEVVRFI